MSRRAEIQVGIMTMAGLVILVGSVIWLKQFNFIRHMHTWLVRFEQTGGLAASDEVWVNGIRLGAVKDVNLIPGGVLVHLSLDSQVHLTHADRVSVRNVGLMGEKVIAVDLMGGGPPYSSRDTIPGVYEKGMAEVMADVGPAVSAIGDLGTRLQDIATSLHQNGDLGVMIQNLRSTSEDLRSVVQENRRALRSTVENFQASSRTVKSLTTDREAQVRREARPAVGPGRLAARDPAEYRHARGPRRGHARQAGARRSRVR
jgi:phospholipid/cholesterol/gamma-HCH transport system substrate-binding protein